MLLKNTSMLMARGNDRSAYGANKPGSTNGSHKGLEIFSTEFDINKIPSSARTLLTKGYIQDEINDFSGATVSTRGRFMTEQEKSRCSNERPLYLYIQGHEKMNVDFALQKIHEIIKSEHQNSLNRPSRFTNAPPPLMSLRSDVSSVEKICVGIENSPPGFELRGRIIGAGGSNLLYIQSETGATVTLRGRGSQFTDPVLGIESPKPLHLYIEHQKPELLQRAKQLAINLIQTVQSELQSYIQQQPPPVQSQQVLDTSQLQQIQQTHFQTMNIGALGQSNVVTIQHQDIIQHPQSSVVTLPATILTATMTGSPGTGVLPPNVHIPAHSGSIGPQDRCQEHHQSLISSPHSVGQVQLIGPPPINHHQVQYRIHSGQPLHIQVPVSTHSTQHPVTQMYVMSQPPPQSPSQSEFSSATLVDGTVSYVYTQPNMQRSATPQTQMDTINANLQQPPPLPPPSSASLNITHQPPPPSLFHFHFPPPNFAPNQPPPPPPPPPAISETYQIQYQEVQTGSSQTKQFVLHPQQAPPPISVRSNEGIIDENIEQPPQPVPPPQIVPPLNRMTANSMKVLTSVPPPNHQQPSVQNAPWIFQAHRPPLQDQLQVQMLPPQVQTQIHHTQQLQYQNGHMQAQVHYAVQPSHHSFELDKPESSEQQKVHGVKRRFNDSEGPEGIPAFYCGPPPIQRHGNGVSGERQQLLGHGPPPGPAHDERNKLQNPGEKHSMEHKQSRLSPGNDQNEIFGLPMAPGKGPPSKSWQRHQVRPWMRPPPTNIPSPQTRPPSGQVDVDQNRSLDRHINVEHNQMPPYNVKPPSYNSLRLMQSICNPPPPPLSSSQQSPLLHHQHHHHSHPHQPHPHHQHHQQKLQFSAQHYHIPVSQGYQWIN